MSEISEEISAFADTLREFVALFKIGLDSYNTGGRNSHIKNKDRVGCIDLTYRTRELRNYQYTHRKLSAWYKLADAQLAVLDRMRDEEQITSDEHELVLRIRALNQVEAISNYPHIRRCCFPKLRC